MKITDGMKVIVCSKVIPMGYTQYCIIPTDELQIPNGLKIYLDESEMEKKVAP